LLLNLANASIGQEKRAEDALVDLMLHLDWYDEDGFLMSVTGTSNDSGPDNAELFGLIDYQIAYGKSKILGDIYRMYGTFTHDPPVASLPSGSMPVEVPVLKEFRRVKNGNGKIVEATMLSASWNERRDHAILDYPKGSLYSARNVPEPNSMNELKGNVGMLELLPIQEFFMKPISSQRYQNDLSCLELESEKFVAGETSGSWLLGPNKTSRFKMIFAKKFNWLPRRIEIEFTNGKTTPSGKLWDVDLEWVRVGDRFLQSKSASKSYFPNGRIKAYEFQFRWKLQSQLPANAFQELMQSGFDPVKDKFDEKLLWNTTFHEMLAR